VRKYKDAGNNYDEEKREDKLSKCDVRGRKMQEALNTIRSRSRGQNRRETTVPFFYQVCTHVDCIIMEAIEIERDPAKYHEHGGWPLTK
jgi:hypothetical protein